MKRAALALAAALAMPAAAQTVAKVYAAGSLRAALTEAAAAFRQQGGEEVAFEFGPSGLLRDRLMKGEPADLFASANLEHPEALARAGRSGGVRTFARNQLCALAPARAGISPDTLLERMLDPRVRLGTSTPKADPSGDYAWQVFEKAGRASPGAYEILSRKALQLVGGPASPPPPPDRSAYAALVAGGRADIFLTYCTNATLAVREEPSLAVVALPETLAVGAEYGLVTTNGASRAGEAFARFLLGPHGQRILATAGFSAPR